MIELAVDHKDHYAVIRLAGKFRRESQSELKAAMDDLVGQGVRRVLLDLRDLEYLDSAGLGSCAVAQKMIRLQGGGRLAMFGASPSVAKMWKLIRLDLVIPVFEREEEAAAELLRVVPLRTV